MFILNNQSAELNFDFNAKSLLFSINDQHFSWLWLKALKMEEKLLAFFKGFDWTDVIIADCA